MHSLGVLLIVASTAFYALAGIFTKATSADSWAIACWRGLIGSVVIAAYVYVRRDRSKPAASFRLGRHGWGLVVVAALSSLFFIASFKKHTYVGNVAVIYATIPFMAAALDWLVLRKPSRIRTLVTAVVSLVGVAIIMAGSFASGHLFGDVLAIAMTFGCAVYLVMIRAFHDTPVVWAAAMGAFLLFPVGWIATDPLAISAYDFLVIAGFGLSFAIATILWTEGGRLLPAAEAGLLGASEIPMAMLFAWLILAEAPPLQSIVGGGIVLAAVLAHAGRDMLAERHSATA